MFHLIIDPWNQFTKLIPYFARTRHSFFLTGPLVMGEHSNREENLHHPKTIRNCRYYHTQGFQRILHLDYYLVGTCDFNAVHLYHNPHHEVHKVLQQNSSFPLSKIPIMPNALSIEIWKSKVFCTDCLSM